LRRWFVFDFNYQRFGRLTFSSAYLRR
jgi:hypothetical protein